jgi:4-hydroxybenzoate polyprenyltransferase
MKRRRRKQDYEEEYAIRTHARGDEVDDDDEASGGRSNLKPFVMTRTRTRTSLRSSKNNNDITTNDAGNAKSSKKEKEQEDDRGASNDDGKQEDDDDDERMVLEDSPRIFIAPNSVPNQDHATAAAAVIDVDLLKNIPEPTVRSCWRDLWAMCRPSNYLGVVVFHVLGTYLGLRGTNSIATAAGMATTTAGAATTATALRTILMKPQMCIVLLALLLTSSTSMMVNDYYDTRSGVDASKINKPMVSGRVPLRVAKRFLSYLYATLLLSLVVVPGMASRLAIAVGAMLTFWYTQHLKPITWLKNVTCAALIALSPFTSGAAALELLAQQQGGSSMIAVSTIWNVTSLWRLFGMLFCGFLGREILMDINDVVDDRLHRVKTVPVKYGRRFASRVALMCTLSMSMLSLMITTIDAGANSFAYQRRIMLALAGSLSQSMRAVQVVLTDGEDPDVVERAVEEGKTTVLLLLASFV